MTEILKKVGKGEEAQWKMLDWMRSKEFNKTEGFLSSWRPPSSVHKLYNATTQFHSCKGICTLFHRPRKITGIKFWWYRNGCGAKRLAPDDNIKKTTFWILRQICYFSTQNCRCSNILHLWQLYAWVHLKGIWWFGNKITIIVSIW